MTTVDGTALYHDTISTINSLRAENGKLKRMLADVINAHYGVDTHHIGDGDGLPPDRAADIAQWWREYLDSKYPSSPQRARAAS